MTSHVGVKGVIKMIDNQLTRLKVHGEITFHK